MRIISCIIGIVSLGILAVAYPLGAQPTEIQYLSGTDKNNTVLWDFSVSSGRNAGIPSTIPVPSCWEMQGFGTYQYGQNGSVSNAETGTYSYTFPVPADWAGKRVFMVFEGVFTDAEVLVNGLPPGVAPTNSASTNSTSLPNDRALQNTSATAGGTGGVAVSTDGNTLSVGTLNRFTMSGWIKPTADFSTLSGTVFPRIINLGAVTNYDLGATNGFGMLLYHSGGLTAALQVKINADTGNGVRTAANVLTGSDWVFVAVTYDSTLPNNHVKVYVGNKTGSLAAPVTTASYNRGPVAFGASAYASLLNRNARDRAFSGWGDDFRFFTNALDQVTLDSIRASALSNTAPPALASPAYAWNFDGPTTSTTVTPSAGAGGMLTLQDASGSAADLYGAIGSGVSGMNAAPGLRVIHRGGYYEFSYDVTSNLVPGASTNRLDVSVRRWSTDRDIVEAEQLSDYWNFSGIYRPVYLAAKPAAYIDRLAIDPKASGEINVRTYLGGITNAFTLNAFVTDTNNVQLGNAFSAPVSAGVTNVLLSASLPLPNPWSAEFPTLYTLTVELRDGNNALVHTVTNSLGFRTITYTNGQGFFVNGKKIIMRGVNRHEFWPDSGRTMSRDVCIQDIQLIKDMNMNAVRLAHYPHSRIFMEECDRLGLYVLDEFNSYQYQIDTANGARLIGEMVRRDVNYACIFAWANGNESGANPNLDGGAAGSTNYFAVYDIQNRRVIRPQQGTAVFNNVVTDHYENYSGAGSSVTNYLRPGATTVFMPTEMLHGLYDGGGGACLAEMWEVFRTATNSGGLFLWALHDEGIVNEQAGFIDVKGQSAPDGLVGPYREKEASYYTCKAIFSPVQIDAPDLASFAGVLGISNRFDFTGLNQCQFRWQLGWFPDPTDSATNFSNQALTGGLIIGTNSGFFAGPSLAPGLSGVLSLPSFPAWSNYDALRVTATDPFGNNIYTWTWPLRTVPQVRDRVVGVASASAPGTVAGSTANEIVVTNGPRVLRFSKTTGVLTSVTVSNQPVSFANGPSPVAGPAWSVTSFTNYSEAGSHVIAVNDLTSSSNAFQWSIRADGWVTLKYRYTLTGLQPTIGVTFDYPSNNVSSMNWLGQGPFRVWKNRRAGQEIFGHTKTYNNTWTGQRSGYAGWNGTEWEYPEFAGYHGQLYWASLETTEQPITIVASTSNLFLRVLTPPNTDRFQVNPAFPPGTISLLHGISAIGDKFNVSSTIGPSAATNVATGLYTGEVSFFFGQLPASSTDRDGNGLVDAWELKNFGALRQNPGADPDADGLNLFTENAFDLSPTIPDAGSPRLPRAAAGVQSPVAMQYHAPLAQFDFFGFVPGISDDLQNWFWADAYPSYFITSSNLISTEMWFSVEPNLLNWTGNANHLFLRLKLRQKN
ncbi:MAG: hypothetical protein H7Y43_03955 [Akkermansiaceae bacterium]|nr:hypothetical protein [Verrucomicrobiales bacterium]